MKTKETSTRQQAIAWWNNLPTWGNPSKEYYIGLYYSDDTVTSERIEETYDKEVLEPKRQEEWQESQVNRRYPNPNQKQYKQFDESLFLSYINKFSDEDKLKALNILYKEICILNSKQASQFILENS